MNDQPDSENKQSGFELSRLVEHIFNYIQKFRLRKNFLNAKIKVVNLNVISFFRGEIMFEIGN